MAEELRALKPRDAIQYFESKGFALPDQRFDWRDVWQDEHARAFTVAKAMRMDVLADIREAVDKAIREGTTLAQFRKELEPLLQAKGWWGRKNMIDPLTGQERVVQLGSPRRLRTIFDTNLRTSYAVGSWARIERNRDRRPFLMYSAVLDSRTRKEHRDWHHTVLPVDHAFWSQHYPPNGWHCRCKVVQLSERELQQRGLRVGNAPTVRTRSFRNKRTGEVSRVPEGIDPGFSYNVGRAHMRGLTPPPATGPLSTPAINPPATTIMPPIRESTVARVLPDNLTANQYAGRFLDEFGATPGKPVVFRDALDEPVVISSDLFVDRRGRSKLENERRRVSMLLMADSLKSPDEIWWTWELNKASGRHEMRRRYITRWNIEGREIHTLLSFGTGADGWHGITAFDGRRPSYFLGQRRGVLAYRRSE